MKHSGTALQYWRGCRCLPCRAAVARYWQHAQAQRRCGVRRWIRAAVAHRLLSRLEREGWTRGRVALALGNRWPTLKLGAQWVRAQTVTKLRALLEEAR